MNEAADTREVIAADEMVHDVMAITLDELKAQSKVWHLLSEDEQDAVIERTEKRVRDAVRECVRHVSAAGFVRAPAKIESVTVKNGTKVVLSLTGDDSGRHELIDAQGTVCLIVLANASDIAEQMHEHEPDANQPDLPLADDPRNEELRDAA